MCVAGEMKATAKVRGTMSNQLSVSPASYLPTVSGAFCQLHLLHVDALPFVPSHPLALEVRLIAI